MNIHPTPVALLPLRLRQIRLSLNLTTQAVAQRAGVDRTTISTYESRRAFPSQKVLENWEAALVALAKECRANAQIALNDLGAA